MHGENYGEAHGAPTMTGNHLKAVGSRPTRRLAKELARRKCERNCPVCNLEKLDCHKIINFTSPLSIKVCCGHNRIWLFCSKDFVLGIDNLNLQLPVTKARDACSSFWCKRKKTSRMSCPSQGYSIEMKSKDVPPPGTWKEL